VTAPRTTPAQTVGPFFAVPGALPWPGGPYAVPDGTPGAVRIGGRVVDGAGEPVPDALVETWQVTPDDGAAPVRGFGRCATDADGRYWILTVKPRPLPTPDGRVEAPHLDVSVFARGLLHRLVTRIYFPDETAANARDPVLSEIADEDVRATLIARVDGDGLRFDIHLQGPDETAFFTV
jgi:protocatechuate 3,4-dioxygenase, alpha subunit